MFRLSLLLSPILLPPVLLLSAGLLAGCAARSVAVAVQSPPVPVAPVAPPMPAGGVPGMVIPARAADGGWPTPGRALSVDGAVWHLRAALNVAALVCRDAGQGEAVVGAYNAMLAGHRTALAAATALADMAALPDDDLAAFAADRLPQLERPFADFFTAYAAWRDGAAAPADRRPVIAVSAAAPVASLRVVAAVPPRKPWLGVDPAVYRMP